MTDTARSLAAIKALFADNSSRDISAQDLRDFVESVASPVSGDILGPTVARSEVAFHVEGLSVHTDRWADFSSGDVLDAEGLVIAGSYSSVWFGDTVPANSSVLLTPGLWTFATQGFLASDPGSTKRSQFYLDFTEDTSALGDPLYGGPAGMRPYTSPIPGGLGSPSQDFDVYGFVRQSQAMYDAGFKLGLRTVQTSASPINLIFLRHTFWRVG